MPCYCAQRRRQVWAWGLAPAKCRLAPIVKQAGQDSGSQLCGNFQILIVSAVKICKQCRQTASSFGRLCFSNSLLVLPLDPTEVPQIVWATARHLDENSWRRY